MTVLCNDQHAWIWGVSFISQHPPSVDFPTSGQSGSPSGKTTTSITYMGFCVVSIKPRYLLIMFTQYHREDTRNLSKANMLLGVTIGFCFNNLTDIQCVYGLVVWVNCVTLNHFDCKTIQIVESQFEKVQRVNWVSKLMFWQQSSAFLLSVCCLYLSAYMVLMLLSKQWAFFSKECHFWLMK